LTQTKQARLDITATGAREWTRLTNRNRLTLKLGRSYKDSSARISQPVESMTHNCRHLSPAMRSTRKKITCAKEHTMPLKGLAIRFVRIRCSPRISADSHRSESDARLREHLTHFAVRTFAIKQFRPRLKEGSNNRGTDLLPGGVPSNISNRGLGVRISDTQRIKATVNAAWGALSIGVPFPDAFLLISRLLS
jgi:hypothetical protein